MSGRVGTSNDNTQLLKSTFGKGETMEPDRGSKMPNQASGRNRRDLLRMGSCVGIAVAFGLAGPSCHPWCSKKDETTAKATTEAPPADWKMIAYCCLECDKCDVYVATQNNDEQLRAKVAKEWKMDAEKLYCNGCKSDKALLNCEAKKCAVARGLPTCAHCDDFPTCDKEIWTKWPQLKEKAETMRGRLRLSS